MEMELSAEAKDRRLNRVVALTVVVLSVFTGVANIKDGNIVQAMAQAQANSLDRWNEYQAARVKLHVLETGRAELAATAPSAPAIGGFDADAARYRTESPNLRRQALDFSAQYDALNVHDDQFDASEAAIATAISIAAVAALTESWMAIYVAWAFGAFGLFMGLCGFLGLPFHPDLLSNLLG